MPRLLVLSAIFFLASCSNIPDAAGPSSDAPEYAPNPTLPFKAADSYEQVLHIWKTAEDINAWIAANFAYDLRRAFQLSEVQRTQNEQLAIYTPAEFFELKAGVCVDLARFGVETLKQSDPQSDPKYLLVDFDPMQIACKTLRLHWLVSFKRDGQSYFFADSKRPGHIAGPYNNTQEFINDYARYRGRKIVAFREVESFQKQRRTPALKTRAPE